LTFREVQAISRSMKGLNLVAVDICEYAPAHDSYDRPTAYNVAALIFEYLCTLVDTKVRLYGGKYNQTRRDLNMATSATFPGKIFLDRWAKDRAVE
jgi:hypothetical protein